MAKNLFTYGTLMRGEQRHSILEDAKYLGDGFLVGAHLWDTHCGFPALTLFDDPEHPEVVFGEVYEVTSDATWEALDVLEGGLYDRMDLEVHLSAVSPEIVSFRVQAYVWKLSFDGLTRICSGLWKVR